MCVLAPRASVPSIILLSLYVCLFLLSIFQPPPLTDTIPRPPVRQHLDGCTHVQHAGKEIASRHFNNKCIKCKKNMNKLSACRHIYVSASSLSSTDDGVQKTNGFLRVTCLEQCARMCCGRYSAQEICAYPFIYHIL